MALPLHKVLTDSFFQACSETRASRPYNQAAQSLYDGMCDRLKEKFGPNIDTYVVENVNATVTLFARAVIQEVTDVAVSAEIFRHDDIIMPTGTKYICSQGNRLVVVIEQKPSVRTVTFSNNIDDPLNGRADRYERFNLAFPYVIFAVVVSLRANNVLSVEKIRVGYSPRSIYNLEDTVYMSNFPNTDLQGNVCMGVDSNDKSYYAQLLRVEVAKAVEHAISHFWEARFTHDIPESFDSYKKLDVLSSLRKWQNATTNDPSFILNIPLNPFGHWNSEYATSNIKNFARSFLDERDDHSAQYINRIKGIVEKNMHILTEKLSEASFGTLQDMPISSRVVKRDLQKVFDDFAESFLNQLVQHVKVAEKSASEVEPQNHRVIDANATEWEDLKCRYGRN